MAQERSDVDSGLDTKKMAQYRCVINITWLHLMKHAMLVKKWQDKVKRTIGSCFNSIDGQKNFASQPMYKCFLALCAYIKNLKFKLCLNICLLIWSFIIFL